VRRTFKGFVALDERGTPLWGSFRINHADAEAFFHRHNPAPPGHERRPRIAPVTILIDDPGS
jgi:hypothetical protein